MLFLRFRLFDNLSQLLFRFHIYYKLVDVKHLQFRNVRGVQKKKIYF